MNNPHKKGAGFASFILIAAAFSANAATISVTTGTGATFFDWQETKGSPLYSWGKLPNERIPYESHSIKNNIKSMVDPYICGNGDTDYSKIALYAVDFTGQNKPGYVLDSSNYFVQGQNFSCNGPMCVPRGKNTDKQGTDWIPCRLILYLGNTPTQAVSETKPKSACPKTAAENTKCRPECPAELEICPALYKYNIGSPTFVPCFVYKWAFISGSEYSKLTKDLLNKVGGRMYMDPPNENPEVPIMVLDKTIDGSCTDEETDTWIDETFQEKYQHRCIKFFQYSESGFVDLYSPTTEAPPPPTKEVAHE